VLNEIYLRGGSTTVENGKELGRKLVSSYYAPNYFRINLPLLLSKRRKRKG
jgi:hypothetical protein